MNQHTYHLIGVIIVSLIGFVLLALAADALFGKFRSWKAGRKQRHSCEASDCTNESCEMIHRRMKKRVDTFQPGLQKFLARWISRDDMYLETQRRCDRSGCSLKGQLQFVKFETKCFGITKSFCHKEDCRENAVPEDFIGPMREKLIKESKPKPVVPFSKKPALFPFPPPDLTHIR